jgi:hypothetical protein
LPTVAPVEIDGNANDQCAAFALDKMLPNGAGLFSGTIPIRQKLWTQRVKWVNDSIW